MSASSPHPRNPWTNFAADWQATADWAADCKRLFGDGTGFYTKTETNARSRAQWCEMQAKLEQLNDQK